MAASQLAIANSRNRKFAFILSCGFLLVSCTGTPSDNAVPNGLETTEPVSSQRKEFPLDEFTAAISFGGLSEEERQRLDQAISLKREEFLAQCMNDAGFEYIPNLNSNYLSGTEYSDFRVDDRDWVMQWGWGVVNYPGRDNPAPPAPEVLDPNQEYLDNLSEAESVAWGTAMYGIWDYETGEAEQLGCQSLADQHFYRETLAVTEEFRPILESIRQVGYIWTESPEFAATHYDWANCMADVGYPGLEHSWDAQNNFFEEYNKFWDNWDWEADNQPYRSPELADLQEREIENALADLDCKEKVDFQARQDQARYDAEAQFVADNRQALEALRDAMEQATTSVVNRVTN